MGENNNNYTVDYTKITLCSFVLFCILWITVFLIVIGATQFRHSGFISFAIAAVTTVALFAIFVKFADKLGATITEDQDSLPPFKRNLAPWENVIVFFYLIYLVASYTVYEMVSVRAGKIMAALIIVAFLVEAFIRLMKKRGER